jgi:hypothetical protein
MYDLNSIDYKNKSSQSAKWFRNRIRAFVSYKKNNETISANIYDSSKHPFIGGLFTYIYDPKWKDILPYYDIYPLTIPIEIYKDGWLGLNLHYLHPNMRVLLLAHLGKLKKTNKTNISYMKVSYSSLKKATASDLVKPCIKRYLVSHVKSKLLSIGEQDWELVAAMPYQKFMKKSAMEIWSI